MPAADSVPCWFHCKLDCLAKLKGSLLEQHTAKGHQVNRHADRLQGRLDQWLSLSEVRPQTSEQIYLEGTIKHSLLDCPTLDLFDG